MVQEGVDLVFIVEGAGAAEVIESNALLPPPPPPFQSIFLPNNSYCSISTNKISPLGPLLP